MSSATTPSPRQTPESVLKSVQLVVLALIAGLMMAAGVMGFLGLSRAGGYGNGGTAPLPMQPQPAPGAPTGSPAPLLPTQSTDPLSNVLAWAVPGLFVLSVCSAFAAGPLLKKQAARVWEARADDEAATVRAVQSFSALTVMRSAFFEGPGLFGAVAVMLTGNAFFLIAPAVCVLLLALGFPTGGRLQGWLDDVAGGPATSTDPYGPTSPSSSPNQ